MSRPSILQKNLKVGDLVVLTWGSLRILEWDYGSRAVFAKAWKALSYPMGGF